MLTACNILYYELISHMTYHIQSFYYIHDPSSFGVEIHLSGPIIESENISGRILSPEKTTQIKVIETR